MLDENNPAIFTKAKTLFRITSIGTGSGKSHADAAARKFMLSSIRFIKAKPHHALTSREVNFISKSDEVSDDCANPPYLIAIK